jgi:chromosome partitioning protein
MEKMSMEIISFTNQKGGVGKTTTCVNFSTYMALKGKKVLLVDINPQGNASTNLGIQKNKLASSIYEVLTSGQSISNTIIKTQVNNLNILPSSIHLVGAEVDLVSIPNREKVLKNVLSGIKHLYDYIFIDCPPSLGLLTINALTASDSVIIPLQCEFFALEGLTQLMNTIKLIKQKLNPSLDVSGVLLTMYDNRSSTSKKVASEIKGYFGKKVFTIVIPRTVRLSEAPSHGVPIEFFDRRSSGAIAYKALVEEFLSR